MNIHRWLLMVVMMVKIYDRNKNSIEDDLVL
jgi:hypothetical protein